MMGQAFYSVTLRVQTKPGSFSRVCYELGKLPDTHFGFLERKAGKIVVILESELYDTILEWMDMAYHIAGVQSVSVISKYSETAALPA